MGMYSISCGIPVKRRQAGGSSRLPVSPDSLSVSYLLSRLFPLPKWLLSLNTRAFFFWFLCSEWGMIFFFFFKKLGISRTLHIDSPIPPAAPP